MTDFEVNVLSEVRRMRLDVRDLLDLIMRDAGESECECESVRGGVPPLPVDAPIVPASELRTGDVGLYECGYGDGIIGAVIGAFVQRFKHCCVFAKIRQMLPSPMPEGLSGLNILPPGPYATEAIRRGVRLVPLAESVRGQRVHIYRPRTPIIDPEPNPQQPMEPELAALLWLLSKTHGQIAYDVVDFLLIGIGIPLHLRPLLPECNVQALVCSAWTQLYLLTWHGIDVEPGVEDRYTIPDALAACADLEFIGILEAAECS